jgi:hypothetical protein
MKRVTQDLIKKRFFQILVISLILSTVGPSVFLTIAYDLNQQGQKEKQDAITAYTSQINPFRIDTSNSSEFFWVDLGGNKAGDTISVISKGCDIVNNEIYLGQKLPIAVNIVGNQLLISANVSNLDNQLVAYFVNNTWKSDTPNMLSIGDRNYNQYAFEIIDRNNVSIFSVRIIGYNEIAIGGLFNSSDELLGISNNGGGAVISPSQEWMKQNLAPIFKYPSNEKDNIGKLVNSNYPQTSPTLPPIKNDWDSLFFESEFLNVIGWILTVSGVFLLILSEIIREKDSKPTGKRKRH